MTALPSQKGVVIKMNVTGSGITMSYIGTAGDPDNLYNTPSQTGDMWTVELINISGAALPNSGGPGTGWIYLLGLIFTGLAGIVLLMKESRKAA